MGLPVCWGVAVVSFVAIAWLRLPLVSVLLGVGSLASLWANRQLGRARETRVAQ